MNDYLDRKISESLNGQDIGKFKYASIKYRVKEKKEYKKNKAGFSFGDLVFTKNSIWLLNFNKSKKSFDIILQISVNDLVRLTENKYVANCFIIYDSQFATSGLEIISESNKSMMNLIDIFYQQTLKGGSRSNK